MWKYVRVGLVLGAILGAGYLVSLALPQGSVPRFNPMSQGKTDCFVLRSC